MKITSNFGGHSNLVVQRPQSRVLLVLLALGNLRGPHMGFYDNVLFKGPVRGACCASPRHGFKGFVWGFSYNFRLFAIFYAGFLTLSVDSTNYETFSFFLPYLYCIRSFNF